MMERDNKLRIGLGLTVVTVLSLLVYVAVRADRPAVDETITAESETVEPSITESGGNSVSTTSATALDFEALIPDDPLPTFTPPPASIGEPPSGDDSGQPDGSSEDPTAEGPPPGPADIRPSGPIRLSGESGIVIEELAISNPDGPCVVIEESADVVIRDSEIGPCGGQAVVIERSSSVRVESLLIADSTSGVHAVESQGVKVTGNVFRDAGRNFVQFDKVTGGGNVISGNSGANKLGGSSAEDMISVYRSSGTASSPLMVIGNAFRNGGPSSSGSGIMVGDNGGAHIEVRGNTLSNPGQVGIGVPGGTDIKVVGNTIFSAAHAWSNVGIYVWNQSGGSCGEIEVRGNRVEWYSADGSPSPHWDGGNCGTISGWDDNDWNASLG